MDPSRLVPLALLAAGTAVSVGAGGDLVKRATDYARVMTTQHELAALRQHLEADAILDQKDLPAPEVPGSLERYIRREAHATGRDPSRDAWGTPYGVDRTDSGNLLVWSLGPNKAPDACSSSASDDRSAAKPGEAGAKDADDICVFVQVK